MELNRAAQGTRPELCFRVVELSTHFKNGNVRYLKLIKKSIRDIQNKDVVIH